MYLWYHGFNKWGLIALTDWDEDPAPMPSGRDQRIFWCCEAVWLVPGTGDDE